MATTLASDFVVVPVPVAPGGSVVLDGAWNVGARDLVIDACQSGRSAGAPAADGAIDVAAGGWRISARDWSLHRCTLIATGRPAPACDAVGLASPCLVSRLRLVANQLDPPMSVAELRADLAGAIQVTARVPAIAAPSEAPNAANPLHTVGSIAAVIAMVIIGVVFGHTWRVRRHRPERRLRVLANGLARRLRSAEPVFRPLAERVKTLAHEAGPLARSRDRLRARARDLEALRTRRRRVADGSGGGEACALLDKRIARAEGWLRDAERAELRIERSIDTLRALQAQLDDANDTDPAAASLAALDDELAIALEASREVERSTG